MAFTHRSLGPTLEFLIHLMGVGEWFLIDSQVENTALKQVFLIPSCLSHQEIDGQDSKESLTMGKTKKLASN